MVKGHECGTHSSLTPYYVPGFVEANRVHSPPPQEVLFPGWMDGSFTHSLCVYRSWSDVAILVTKDLLGLRYVYMYMHVTVLLCCLIHFVTCYFV